MPAWFRCSPYLPWTDGTGRPWPGWHRLPRAAPIILGYLAVSWLLFLLLADGTDGRYAVDQVALRDYLYAIPDLPHHPLRVARALLTAPFLNHNDVQIVYVTVLLLVFGVVFEAREGTHLTLGIFLGTTWVAAIVAAILLHLVYPEVLDRDVLQRAWQRTWSGGSAGAFGLMGAVAARARKPWLLFILVVLWEVNVAYWYLKHYTPAFHLTALVLGFVIVRYAVAPVSPDARVLPRLPRIGRPR